MAKQYGGWYWQPDQNRALRWWGTDDSGQDIYTEGEEPTGGTTASVSGSSSSRSRSNYLTPGEVADASTGIIKTKLDPFDWDYEQAELDALEKLRPYYEELIERAEGDWERALAYLTEDYDTGQRYRREDYDTITQQLQIDYDYGQRYRDEDLATTLARLDQDFQVGTEWREEDLAVALQNYDQLDEVEKERLDEMMNKRGMLDSSIAETEGGRMTDDQLARREAVERAMSRNQQMASISFAEETTGARQGAEREGEQAFLGLGRAQDVASKALARGDEDATSTYERATTEGGIKLERDVEDLSERQKQEALDMAALARERGYGRHLIEQQQFIS